MREKIADKIAKGIEHLLSKAQVIDRINNDEIVKRQDYLSIASGVQSLMKEEIEKVENLYNVVGELPNGIEFRQMIGAFEFEQCRQAILALFEEEQCQKQRGQR